MQCLSAVKWFWWKHWHRSYIPVYVCTRNLFLSLSLTSLLQNLVSRHPQVYTDPLKTQAIIFKGIQKICSIFIWLFATDSGGNRLWGTLVWVIPVRFVITGCLSCWLICSTRTKFHQKFVVAKWSASLRHPAQENLKFKRVSDSTQSICLPHHAYYVKSWHFLLL